MPRLIKKNTNLLNNVDDNILKVIEVGVTYTYVPRIFGKQSMPMRVLSTAGVFLAYDMVIKSM